MADDLASPKAEIVIIRRRSGEDLTAPKGGAWKIAYADFVTAMMAFFLVMWLINAANEATRAQVASYFNPIKLTDSSTGGKGLNDPKDGKKKKEAQAESSGEHAASPAEKAKEEKILANPVAVLDKIAGHAAPTVVSETPIVPEVSETVTDPFDALAWQTSNEKTERTEAAGKLEKTTPEPKQSPAAKPKEKPIGAKQTSPAESAGQHGSVKEKPSGPATDAVAEEAEAGKEEKGENATKITKDKIDLAVKVKQEILHALNLQPEQLPANLDIEGTDEGLLISLTDKTDYGMFNVGSAEPNAKVIELVAVIGEVLKNHRGFIVIRGHTDSRPYRNKKYDNWQLSTARAHMAYYMLVRGGLDEQRVRRVEGLADRDPKVKGKPEAPENRRIDILLGQDQ